MKTGKVPAIAVLLLSFLILPDSAHKANAFKNDYDTSDIAATNLTTSNATTSTATQYLFDVPFGTVCLNGTFPITITTASGSVTGTLETSISPKGAVSGQLLLGSETFGVTGKHTATTKAVVLSLSAANGKDKIKLIGTLQGTEFAGTTKGSGSVAPGKGTFILDVSSASSLVADVNVNLVTSSNGALSGTGTVTVCGSQTAVTATGKSGATFTLSIKGGSFRWSGKGSNGSDGNLTVAWSGAGFGCTINGTNLPIVQVVETTQSQIPAAEGGTVSLPSGTSITIQPGALTEDQTVTLTLVSALPTQPPGKLIVGAGPALIISTEPVSGAHAAKNVSHRVSEQLSEQAPDSTQLILNTGTYSITGAAQSVAMTDVVDLSGGDNFIGIPAQLNNNVATASLPAALFENSKAVRFSLAKLRPAVELQPLPTPGATIWNTSASNWVDGTPDFDCSKKTLVVVHGMASQVQEAFPGDTVQKIMAAGGYQQVVGFNYNWTQGITNSGQQLAAFLGSLKTACPDIQVDIEAHSEGVPVALSAACQTTNMPIGHIVMLGGPIMGTPAASLGASLQLQLMGASGALLSIPITANALTTTLLNVPNTYVPPVPTLDEIVSGQFAADLLPDSDALVQTRACVCAKMADTTSNLASTKLIAMAGTDYKSCFGMGVLGTLISPLFGSDSFDGIVGESSARAEGACFDDSRITKESYPICHTALESNMDVINEVGKLVGGVGLYATLTAGTAGTGSGTVTATPSGPTYIIGTVVTLTATPGTGSTFTGWSGAATGAGKSIKIKMDGNKSVTATFTTTPVSGLPAGFPTDLPTGTYVMTSSADVSSFQCCSGSPPQCATFPGYSTPLTTVGTFPMTNLKTFAKVVVQAFNSAVAASVSPGCSQSVSYSPFTDDAFTVTYTATCSSEGCTDGITTFTFTLQKQ
ncbi:MAG: hypothetical protein ABSG82_08985 [Sedimentisphaerales bacterium]|jgi:hypothetical protein